MQTGERKLITSQQTLPDIFVIRYAGGLSASALYAYLWINTFYHDRNFDLKNIYDSAILSKRSTDEALAELVANDLLIRNGNSFRQTDIVLKEVEESFRLNQAYKEYAADLPEESRQRNMLAESIQNTFYQGKMAYVFSSLIDKCLFEYKFEQTVVYSMFQEGLEQNIVKNISAMRNLARTWYDKGITNESSLAEYKQINRDVKHCVEVMGKLTRRRLNDLDIKRIEKWIIDLNCSVELIEYAYRANEYRGNIQLKHVEETLTKWVSAGITDVKGAARYEEENHKENKRRTERRKAKFSGAVTGAEAGLTTSDDDDGDETKPASTSEEEDKPAFGGGDSDEKDDGLDDILDLFGGEDDQY